MRAFRVVGVAIVLLVCFPSVTAARLPGTDPAPRPPAPYNPSCSTSASSWSASVPMSVVRDTGVYDSYPASCRLDNGGAILASGGGMIESFAGYFDSGTHYTLSLRTFGLAGAPVLWSFGGPSTDYVTTQTATTGAWQTVTIDWTPVATTNRVSMNFNLLGGMGGGLGMTAVYVDSLTLSPTQAGTD